jgi:hypothetical protein
MDMTNDQDLLPTSPRSGPSSSSKREHLLPQKATPQECRLASPLHRGNKEYELYDSSLKQNQACGQPQSRLVDCSSLVEPAPPHPQPSPVNAALLVDLHNKDHYIQKLQSELLRVKLDLRDSEERCKQEQRSRRLAEQRARQRMLDVCTCSNQLQNTISALDRSESRLHDQLQRARSEQDTPSAGP